MNGCCLGDSLISFHFYCTLLDVLLEKDVLKGKITAQDKQDALARVTTTHAIDSKSFGEADFVIEGRRGRVGGGGRGKDTFQDHSPHSIFIS